MKNKKISLMFTFSILAIAFTSQLKAEQYDEFIRNCLNAINTKNTNIWKNCLAKNTKELMLNSLNGKSNTALKNENELLEKSMLGISSEIGTIKINNLINSCDDKTAEKIKKAAMLNKAISDKLLNSSSLLPPAKHFFYNINGSNIASAGLRIDLVKEDNSWKIATYFIKACSQYDDCMSAKDCE